MKKFYSIILILFTIILGGCNSKEDSPEVALYEIQAAINDRDFKKLSLSCCKAQHRKSALYQRFCQHNDKLPTFPKI